MELITGKDDKGRRLDRILRKALPDYPLPLIHRLLRQKQVFVNGKPAKAQDHIDCGVIISIPSRSSDADRAVQTKSSGNLLEISSIIWEDCGLIAVNKPPGLAVHGPGSLDLMVRAYLADKLPPSLSFKPGPLHRLDKPSSGIVVFSTNLEGARLFSEQLQKRQVRKTYLTIVEGTLNKEETWHDELVRDREIKKTFVSKQNVSGIGSTKFPAGKTAITMVTPLVNERGYTLIKAEIVTGRTHQIRAQAAAHGYPLAGDVKYGGHSSGGFFLHAWKMEFMKHSIEAPLPLNTYPNRFSNRFHKCFSAIVAACNAGNLDN